MLLSTTAVLLSLSNLASAQPTRQRTEVKLVQAAAAEPVVDKRAIPLAKRSLGQLQERDGSVNWGKTHAHIARAQSKYSRSLKNIAINSPADIELLTRSSMPSPVKTTWDSTLDSLDWPAEVPVLIARSDDKLFGGGAYVRGGGVAPLSSGKEKLVLKNPNVMARARESIVAAGSAKTGATSLTDYNNGMLWYGSLSVGTPPVTYSIDFDTGSADLWLPSVNCTSAACNSHSKYDPSSSWTSTLVPSATLDITYGDGSSTTGTVYTDTVSLGGLTATSQTIGAAEDLSASWAADPMDGMVGLGYQSISQMGATPFFQNLMSQGKVAASQFSFKLASTGSELYLGGMNSALYTGSTVWYPVVSQSYWTLSGSVNVGGELVPTVGNFSAVIDTGTSVIVAPTAAAQAFWASVPNSAVYGSGYYTYDCDTPPEISFSFGSTADHWAISSESLSLGKVSASSNRCVGSIVGADVGVSAWVLGGSFLENVYATFDFDKNAVGFSALA